MKYLKIFQWSVHNLYFLLSFWAFKVCLGCAIFSTLFLGMYIDDLTEMLSIVWLIKLSVSLPSNWFPRPVFIMKLACDLLQWSAWWGITAAFIHATADITQHRSITEISMVTSGHLDRMWLPAQTLFPAFLCWPKEAGIIAAWSFSCVQLTMWCLVTSCCLIRCWSDILAW